MTEIEQNVPLSPEVESAFREAYEIGRAVTKTGRVADYIPELAKADEVELAIQINGKVKGRVMVAADADEEDIKQRALDEVAHHTEGKTIRKVIVVKGRLVNIVAK